MSRQFTTLTTLVLILMTLLLAIKLTSYRQLDTPAFTQGNLIEISLSTGN